MKIAQFITHFPYGDQYRNSKKYAEDYHCGGGGRAAFELVNELSKRGHDVIVFTTSKDSKDSVEEINGVKVVRSGKNFKISRTNISFKLFFDPLKYDVDVVHVHNTTAPGVIAGLVYAKRKRKPLVITHHGDEKFSNWGSIVRRIGVYIHVNYLIKQSFSLADIIISSSKYFVEESRYLSKYKDKVKVIPNGIKIEEYSTNIPKEQARRKLNLPTDKKIILFLSVLTPKKGPHILLKAMEQIVEEVPDAMLLMAGSGPIKSELEKLMQKLRLNDKIEFTGYVEETLKPYYYKAADVFCLPSVLATEVFPLTLLEASASGLPLVVSDLTTFKCIVEDGYNGFFTERGNQKKLAERIIYLLQNDDIRERMGRNARRKSEKYSWESIAKEIEEIYEELSKKS